MLVRKGKFTFIDLFAGIGGMRMAFEGAGGRCVYTSEWNKFSAQTYEANFGDVPDGDITKVDASEIPDHDVLVAGFPCQPFSIAGVSKKRSLNMPDGFRDKTQGTLFFDVARIIDAKRPAAFLLENVKNLRSHDGGNTFRVITGTLEELGYDIYHKVIDAQAVVPQHRERVFIVGFDRPVPFEFPEIPNTPQRFSRILKRRVPAKYTLTNNLWRLLQRHAENSKKKGNGFGYGLTDRRGVSRTLSARYYKDGSEVLVAQANKNPRRLTPRECARLMGFPDSFKIPVSDNQAYRQFGNAVVPLVVEHVARAIVPHLTGRTSRTVPQTAAAVGAGTAPRIRSGAARRSRPQRHDG